MFCGFGVWGFRVFGLKIQGLGVTPFKVQQLHEL